MEGKPIHKRSGVALAPAPGRTMTRRGIYSRVRVNSRNRSPQHGSLPRRLRMSLLGRPWAASSCSR